MSEESVSEAVTEVADTGDTGVLNDTAEAAAEAVEESSPLDLFSRDFDEEAPVEASDESEGEDYSEEEGESEEGTAFEAGSDEEGGEDEEEYAYVGVFGESEYEVPEDTVFTDGSAEFTLKEAVNNYATAQDITRKLSALDKERKTWEAEKQQVLKAQSDIKHIDYHLNMMKQCLDRGDWLAANQVMMNMAGGEGTDVVQQMLSQARGITEELSHLSDAELAFRFEQKQLQLDKQQIASRESYYNKQKEQAEISGYVDSVKDKHAISDEELREALAYYQKNGQQIPNSKKEITNMCANWVLAGREVGKVRSAIKRVDATRESDDNLVNQVLDTFNTENLTEEALADVIAGALGKTDSSTQDSSKGVAKKTANSAKRRVVKKAANPEQATNTEAIAKTDTDFNPLDFSSIVAKADAEDAARTT